MLLESYSKPELARILSVSGLNDRNGARNPLICPSGIPEKALSAARLPTISFSGGIPTCV